MVPSPELSRITFRSPEPDLSNIMRSTGEVAPGEEEMNTFSLNVMVNTWSVLTLVAPSAGLNETTRGEPAAVARATPLDHDVPLRVKIMKLYTLPSVRP